MKRGFTLIEVCLAMLIMAGGILSIVGLYSFGYRENAQSREDVASAALADAVLSPLVMAISSTNVKWSAFKNEFNYPGREGWGEYCNGDGAVTQEPTSQGQSAFTATMGKMSGADVDTSFPSAALAASGMMFGLVVQHDEGSAVVRLSFRATRKAGMLFAAPIYYTEARFQGVVDQQ